MRTRYQKKTVDYRIDVSAGKERIPIPLVCPPEISLPKFEYVTDHVVRVPPSRPARCTPCRCAKTCEKKCSCIELASTVTSETIEKARAEMGVSDGDLSSGFDYGIAEIRCSDECYCINKCTNESISNNGIPKVEIRYVDDIIGFGLFAAQNISKNRYIGSYIGELYSKSVYTEFAEEHPYYYMVQPQLFKQKVLIDGLRYGNYTRFINHSCDANIFTKNVYAGSKRHPYPSFYALKTIHKGEQIFMDYGPYYFERLGILCRCGHCNN